MSNPTAKVQLPAIPAKRYFTIGEVSELCGVKPHVLRYWEQEFTQLKPVKRRGNRRYYQHHEVLLIRRIRELLYEQGFTISGARLRLDEANGSESNVNTVQLSSTLAEHQDNEAQASNDFDLASLKAELLEILALLRPSMQATS
ncbi:MAG: MerR family transcriptional regulator [Methylotenera sp.]|jgi:DNA-binding transcriptional MerR regulator|nr:MerR family transcriptional regulator [Methylotenera sp.]HPH07221.1 MerR family transcriptional regulator [Methylotenera sp.]HPM48362.1 MerR family transcriptional regulator [Methylotenera sp.]HPV32566.1 MerR family transcriptional regulator [Methylotenera sp.]HQM87494.1 MerR family transcriptional regulator [Methylotenera sp.]